MTGTATASAIDVGFASRRRATLVGALASLLWAALALIVGGAALAAGGLFARARN